MKARESRISLAPGLIELFFSPLLAPLKSAPRFTLGRSSRELGNDRLSRKPQICANKVLIRLAEDFNSLAPTEVRCEGAS